MLCLIITELHKQLDFIGYKASNYAVNTLIPSVEHAIAFEQEAAKSFIFYISHILFVIQ